MRRLFTLLLMVFLFSPSSVANSGGLAEIVTIKKLLSGDYHGKFITTTGVVTKIELKRGRRRGHFVEIQLSTTEIIGNEVLTYEITAMSMFNIYTKHGDQLIVIGTYKNRGWFGGFLAKEFIAVEFTAMGPLNPPLIFK